MTPADRQTLLNCIRDYGDSLTRIDGERDHCKAIAARVQAELGIEARHFVAVAVATHKDHLTASRKQTQDLADLFSDVQDGEQ